MNSHKDLSKIKRFVVLLTVSTIVSFSGNCQLYYTLGLKAQRVNFLTVYEGQEGYVYDPQIGDWVLSNGLDTNQRKFYSFGPSLCYGYNYEINNRFSVAAELEGYLGLVNIKNDGFYFDFSLAARTSYTLSNSSYSNVFLLIGAGYGMHRGYEDNDVIGVNWRLGYEHDFSGYLIGIALDGNVFLEDLSYYGSVNQENLIARKLNSIGIAAYFSLGKL